MATFALPGTLGAIRDPMSGFFLLQRRVISKAELKPLGYKILLEVLAKGDYTRLEEVPFVFEERTQGGSKIGSSTVVQYLEHLVRISVETGEARRMAQFAFVGLSGALVNLFCYRLFIVLPGWSVWSSAPPASALAVVNNFIWNEKFTFKETHQASPRGHSMWRRFLTFTLLSLIGLVINFAVVVLLLASLHVRWVLGVTAGIALGGAWNFFSNANLTWRAWWDRKALPRVTILGSPECTRGPASES